MRVLLVNSFYYPRGGDCVHLLTLEASLAAAGHDVAVFSMSHPDNLPSPWQSYWPGNVEFADGLGVSASSRALFRVTYSLEVRASLSRLVAEFRPDIAHLHSIHHHLTTSVLDELHRRRIPVVWTLHDYRTVCPASHMLRDEAPCDLCRGGRYWECVVHACKGESRLRSLAAAVEATLSELRGVFRHKVSSFISPSAFLARTVLAMGLPAGRMSVVPNPLDSSRWRASPGGERRGALFVGRLSAEKGVEGLLRAHAQAGAGDLRVVGDGPLRSHLERIATDLGSPVRFDAWLDPSEVKAALGAARVLCVPSLCYENCPTVVLEALAARTAVMGSRIGGLTELLDHGRCGLLLPPADERAWARALSSYLSESPPDVRESVAAGWTRVTTRHDPARFLRRIEDIYREVVRPASGG